MIDNLNLSSYQNPEGLLKDRLVPRTDMRKKMIPWQLVKDMTVLDLGCNNGYFTREAMRQGAKRAVGVDVSNCIIGARQLAKEEGVNAEFWQVNIDSKEFRRHCPRFDVVFLLSALTKLKDKEEFLDWLDGIVKFILIFESNHGEPNKQHIDLVQKHIYFKVVQYLGPSEIPSKPHYMWVCKKSSHEVRYPELSNLPVTFIPLDKIKEVDILDQKYKFTEQDEEYKRLRNDIKKRGFRTAIGVREEGNHYTIWQGGHRYLIAKELGYKEIPCKIIPPIIQRIGGGRYRT